MTRVYICMTLRRSVLVGCIVGYLGLILAIAPDAFSQTSCAPKALLTHSCMHLSRTPVIGRSQAASTRTTASGTTSIAPGDLIVSSISDEVDEYTPSGTFVQRLMTSADGLGLPAGSALDGAGNLYVTDFTNDQILKRDAVTGAVSVFASNSTLGNGQSFNSPESIAFDQGYANLFVSDANRHGPGGGINVVSAATGRGTGFYPLPSSNGSAGTGESDWLAFDVHARLFMTNENPAQGVMQVDQNTGDIVQPSLVANLPNEGYALSFDKNGDLWVGDTDTIREFTPTGAPVATITNSSFSTIFAAVFNKTGDQLYAGDLSTGAVYDYDLQGKLLGSFNASSGVSGLSVAGVAVPPNSGRSGIEIAKSANEPVVAVNPTNPQNIAVAFNHAVGKKLRCGYRVTADGGATWTPALSSPPRDLPEPTVDRVKLEGAGDPSLAFTGSGTLYFGCLSGGDADQSSDPASVQLFGAASSNGGATFGPSRLLVRGFKRKESSGVTQQVTPDLEDLAGDSRPGARTAYMCFQEFVTTSNGNTTSAILELHLGATAGGAPHIQKLGTGSATAGTREAALGCTTTVSSSGKVWVAWRNVGRDRAEADRSDDSGRTFKDLSVLGPMHGNVATCNGGCFNPGRRVYVAASPVPGDDRVVGAWENFEGRKHDDVLTSLYSGGVWPSRPDLLVSGATQPSLAWGADGNVLHGYYRNPSTSRIGAKLTYELNHAPPSTPFGSPLSFGNAPSTELEHLRPFVPPSFQGRFGDYNGVAETNGVAYGVWTDNGSTSGNAQTVWFGHG